jgi:hypothetical protein
VETKRSGSDYGAAAAATADSAVSAAASIALATVEVTGTSASAGSAAAGSAGSAGAALPAAVLSPHPRARIFTQGLSDLAICWLVFLHTYVSPLANVGRPSAGVPCVPRRLRDWHGGRQVRLFSIHLAFVVFVARVLLPLAYTFAARVVLWCLQAAVLSLLPRGASHSKSNHDRCCCCLAHFLSTRLCRRCLFTVVRQGVAGKAQHVPALPLRAAQREPEGRRERGAQAQSGQCVFVCSCVSAVGCTCLLVARLSCSLALMPVLCVRRGCCISRCSHDGDGECGEMLIEQAHVD